MNTKNEKDSSITISGSGDMARMAETTVGEWLGGKGRQRPKGNPNSNPKNMRGFIDIHLNLSQLAIIAAFGITLLAGVSAYLEQNAREEHNANLAEQKVNLAEQIDSGELVNVGFIEGYNKEAMFSRIRASSFGYIKGEDSYGCIVISSNSGAELRCEKMAPEDAIDFLNVDLSEITSAEYLDNGVYKISIDGILNCIGFTQGSDFKNSFSMSCPSSNGEGFDKGYSFNPENSKISVVVDGVETKSENLTSLFKLSDIDYLGNGHKQEIEAMLKRVQNTYGDPKLKKGAKNGI